MQGPCEHCPNPEKAKWTRQCAYVGEWPSQEAFIKSTFDPPCACDDYDESQRELSHRNLNVWLAFALTGIPLLILALHRAGGMVAPAG
jgi:hypothetical protein